MSLKSQADNHIYWFSKCPTTFLTMEKKNLNMRHTTLGFTMHGYKSNVDLQYQQTQLPQCELLKHTAYYVMRQFLFNFHMQTTFYCNLFLVTILCQFSIHSHTKRAFQYTQTQISVSYIHHINNKSVPLMYFLI